MPIRSKGNVILRQWEMIQLIPARDRVGMTAAEIASALATRGFPVTSRTIERDLEELRRVLPLDVDNNARPKRWCWRRQPGLDIPGMEAAEAIAFSLMQEILSYHLPVSLLEALRKRINQANRTLTAIAKAGSRGRWSDKVRVIPAHIILQPPMVPTRIFQTIQTALLQDIPLEAQYRSHQDAEHRKRLLFPRGLILRGSSIYLIAHEKDGDPDPRHYALQRFVSAKLRELEPWPTDAFSLDDFLLGGAKQFGDGAEVTLKAKVSEELGRILRDTPVGKDMRLTGPDEGRFSLTTSVRDTWALHAWILGHAEHIEIEKPIQLRQLMQSRLATAIKQYR
jgi:predicted DNA-binding transcriptional regulator YafY